MPIPQAPNRFQGPLEKLYDKYAQHVLPDPKMVEAFHQKLVAYLAGEDPTFITRNVGRQKRGIDETIACGSRIRPSDNSPAWWIHHHLFNQNTDLLDDFPAAIESIPCEMFRVQLPETTNSAGWHVAQLYDVKDESTDSPNWSTETLTWRTLRNLHPCNYFYIPKTDWKLHATKPEVLAFFQAKYANRYASIWDEFIELAQVIPHDRIIDARSYKFAVSTREKQSRKLTFNNIECSVAYEYSRLCFNAKCIEPLEMNQRFCVVTPNIYFIMTKREFYDNFPSIVSEGSCYRKTGIHHFRSLPQRARPFMIERNR